MDQDGATHRLGPALRIAPGFVATARDDDAGVETTLEARYSPDQGRYVIVTVLNRSLRDDVELNSVAIRQVGITAIMQAATPHCVSVTLDDPADPAARWITYADLTANHGRIVPAPVAAEITKHGSSPARMMVIRQLFGVAVFTGQAPIKLIQLELGVVHRTASDWVRKARTAGQLDGMKYIVGRQADG